MPLEAWAQIAAAKLDVIELAVPLIYLDEKRSFGGALDNAEARLEYYYRVLDASIAATQRCPSGSLVTAPHMLTNCCRTG